MGSPLSPLLAEIFMDHLEVCHISVSDLFTRHVLQWYRYVDDIFAIFDGILDELNTFVSFLNSLHPRINFTFETEAN